MSERGRDVRITRKGGVPKNDPFFSIPVVVPMDARSAFPTWLLQNREVVAPNVVVADPALVV